MGNIDIKDSFEIPKKPQNTKKYYLTEKDKDLLQRASKNNVISFSDYITVLNNILNADQKKGK